LAIKKIDFDGITTGLWPGSGLVSATDGNMYGVTTSGGTNYDGVLFRYNPLNNSVTTVFSFGSNYLDGENPQGQLVLANNGKLYGVAKNGGTSDEGVLFEYDIDDQQLTVKVHFSGVATGSEQLGPMINALNGKL